MNTLKNNLEIYDKFIGKSPEITQIKKNLKRIAETNMSVLLTGETGTGKEVLANYIYQNSLRKDMPFLTINCAGITKTLIESELFGHKKGAFTGATYNKQGYFEIANKGTLFLDEITKLPEEYLSKLLRVVDYGLFLKVGDNKETKVDVRIIAAGSNSGEMPLEFWYRFKYPIELPALRDRKEDIPVLSNHFLKKFNEVCKKNLELNHVDISRLTNWDWPGNIRELKRTIERFVVEEELKFLKPKEGIIMREYSSKKIINPKKINGTPNIGGGITLPETLTSIEIELIKEALNNSRDENGKTNKTKAAKQLGIIRTTLAEKIRRYEIEL